MAVSGLDDIVETDLVTDLAAEEGWEYVLVDEGWDPEWVPELVEYARERGVGVLLWSRWTDLDTEAERDNLLPLWKSWGVAGLKVDFMDSDTQDRMRWYDDSPTRPSSS